MFVGSRTRRGAPASRGPLTWLTSYARNARKIVGPLHDFVAVGPGTNLYSRGAVLVDEVPAPPPYDYRGVDKTDSVRVAVAREGRPASDRARRLAWMRGARNAAPKLR